MSSLILGGLTSRLTDRLAGEKVDLVRQAYSGGPDVNFPLLVVCVNVSRIGADAKEALKGIPKGIHFLRWRVKILRHFFFFSKRFLVKRHPHNVRGPDSTRGRGTGRVDSGTLSLWGWKMVERKKKTILFIIHKHNFVLF